MKRPKMLIVLTLGAVLAAVQAAAQTSPEGKMSSRSPVSPCPTVTVSDVEKPNAQGRRRFSATRSSDLIFHVLFDSRLETEHVVTLKIFTPKGYLYRWLDVPVASGKEKRSRSARRLPGYPYPVPVRAPKTVKVGARRFESVDVSFPIAGSTIVTSSLYGRWNVEVYLDGAAEPCGRPTSFHLKE